MNPLPGTTTEGTKWAYALIRREASGEQIPDISGRAWRETLGFSKETTAKQAIEQIERKAA